MSCDDYSLSDCFAILKHGCADASISSVLLSILRRSSICFRSEVYYAEAGKYTYITSSYM